jgi:hypothetical protein
MSSPLTSAKGAGMSAEETWSAFALFLLALGYL